MVITRSLSTDTLSVELTINEALALSSGVRFAASSHITEEAKRKVLRSLDRKLFPATSKTIAYHELEV
ncbi:hypothetical protein ACFPES_05350 [Paenibacillus sp. GCM10023248]|uniref:hypothetical protein n=1 Tax=unclassified Paenibacillus TaxID=185978 RepID=UPI002378C1FF|nr:hypothetical protein [Paenibacillus sp. MAHUQ-63]MDD9266456.1 hypothetical protein [Paenibacillus sp. MAHUQ-63]